jgi:tRNA(His) 5'-end guanylyltransferase
MTKFKLYEDILSRSWNRYFYDVEANTIEEAVEKVRYGEVGCYDSEQIYEVIDELDPVDNNGSPTREIYNDKDELMWHNAELVNRGEIITQSIRSISENLSLIMEGEPESFRGGDIAFSTARRVMEMLGWKCSYAGKAMKDELGDRMKSYYENRSKTFLARRTPVIIRLDGKAFHTFTRGFNKPFDEAMCNAMQETMKYLCENIQGCVLGYTQSDEITLVLIDYQKLTTDAWFDYNVQKICSVAASMATLIFNRRFQEQIVELSYNGKLDDDELTSSYKRSLKTGAMFDARCFNIPKEEVTNCILWRQQDATRNSISSAGQAHFSHKQLEGLNSNQIQELLFQEKGINWNDYPTKFKRGSCCIKKYHQTMNQTLRSYWFIDNEIPIFKGEDREYIEKLIA